MGKLFLTIGLVLSVQASAAVQWFNSYGVVNSIDSVVISKQETWGNKFPSNPNMLAKLEVKIKATMTGYEKGFSKNIIAHVDSDRETMDEKNPVIELSFGRVEKTGLYPIHGLAVFQEFQEPIEIEVPVTIGGIGKYADKPRTFTLEVAGDYDDKLDSMTNHRIEIKVTESKNQVALQKPVVVKRP